MAGAIRVITTPLVETASRNGCSSDARDTSQSRTYGVENRGSSTMAFLPLSAFLVAAMPVVAACAFPRPPDVGDDAVQPGTVIQVSPEGDDLHDGITLPVKTLKHAIGVASQNSEATTIVLASGRYTPAGGETFPYIVPSNVSILGPSGGGATLVGSKTETGLMIGSGTLRDLEMEDFMTAFVATGRAHLANIRVRTSATALRAETNAQLTVDGLDITGAPASCATGVELNGDASLTAATLVTRALGTSVLAKDQTTVGLTMATVTGDGKCTQPLLVVRSTSVFSMSDSLLDGNAGPVGLDIGSPSIGNPTRAMILNSTIRNADSRSILAGNATGEMIGGALHTAGTLLAVDGGGQWSMTGVSMTSADAAIVIKQGFVKVRNSTLGANSYGVMLSAGASVDLGSASSLGNNTIRNTNIGILVNTGVTSSGPIPAVGNIWNPTQGADTNGKYPVGTLIQGPVDGNNFQLPTSDLSLQL
jgi:hypothetical protein